MTDVTDLDVLRSRIDADLATADSLADSGDHAGAKAAFLTGLRAAREGLDADPGGCGNRVDRFVRALERYDLSVEPTLAAEVDAAVEAQLEWRRRRAATDDVAAGELEPRLGVRSQDLARRGRYREALDARLESVALARRLGTLYPNALHETAQLHAQVDAVDDAAAAAAEAVALSRTLADDNPAQRAWLPPTLGLLGRLELRRGNLDAASAACAEAVTIDRELLDARRVGDATGLAERLLGQADVLAEADDGDGARRAADEAVTIYRAENEKLRGLLASELADAEATLARVSGDPR